MDASMRLLKIITEDQASRQQHHVAMPDFRGQSVTNSLSRRIGPPGEWAAKYTRVAQEWGHARQKKNLSHLILRNWKIAKL
jgi:hypothetical protein